MAKFSLILTVLLGLCLIEAELHASPQIRVFRPGQQNWTRPTQNYNNRHNNGYPNGYRPNTNRRYINGQYPNVNPNPNFDGYRPNTYPYGSGQPRMGNGNRNGTGAAGANAPDTGNGKAVTPEEAMKLYNRPKTNPPPKIKPGSIYPRIGGEFEKQNAVVLSLSEMLPQHGKVMKRITELASGHVKVLVLFNTKEQVQEAIKLFADSKVSLDHVYFMSLKMDTVWLRDFGPIMAEEEDGAMTIDFFYNGQRPTDDTFPKRWADLVKTTHNSVPWTIQGGNLLSNGKGLALTTTRIYDDNKISFPATGSGAAEDTRSFVIGEFKKYTNLQQIEVLEPLRNEATKHVDMFATFIAEDEVLVAQLAYPRLDPENARVLDYNANRLSKLKVNGKPLKVSRIPIPPRIGTSWSPYTNVIIANKLVMMPVMKTDNRDVLRKAVEVYRKKMPDHRVATVDISSMSKLQGALHCLTINIPEYAPLPKTIASFSKAKAWAEKQSESMESKKSQVSNKTSTR